MADVVQLLSSGDAVGAGRAQRQGLDSSAVVLDAQALGALDSTDGQQGGDGHDVHRPQDDAPARYILQ